MHDDDNKPRPDLTPQGVQLPLELLRSQRRDLLLELRDLDSKIRTLEDKHEEPPQRERVAVHVAEILDERVQASASDLVRAVLQRDTRLHAGTVRAYISSLRRDGRLKAVGGRGVPGDPLVLALPGDPTIVDAAPISAP